MEIVFEFMYFIIAGLCPTICYFLVNKKDSLTLSRNARYLIPLGILPYPLIILSTGYLLGYEFLGFGNSTFDLLQGLVFAALPPFIMLIFSVFCLLFIRHKDISKAAKIGFVVMVITGFAYQVMIGVSRI